MRGQLVALRTQIGPAARDAWVVASRSVRQAMAVTGRTSRRWTLICLERVESALLNARARERIHATATFALIFAFAVSSVDFLITGGGEFGAPARAAQPQRPAYTVSRTEPALRAEAMPTALSPDLADATEVSVIAVSQNFGEPLMRSPPMPDEEGLIAASARSEVSLAGESGEPVDEPGKAPDASGDKVD